MSDTDDDLEKLREQTDPGTRAEPSSEVGSDKLEDAIVDTLGKIERGEASKTLSVRDEQLAALVRGLEETDEFDDLGSRLEGELGRTESSEAFDKSEIIRLAIRVGLRETAPEVVERARNAYGQHAADRF